MMLYLEAVLFAIEVSVSCSRRTHFERTIDFSSSVRNTGTDLRLSHDNIVSAQGWLAVTLWPLGFPRQSARASAEAVARSQALKNTMTIALALHQRALLHAGFGADLEAATASSDEAVRYCQANGIAHYEHWARLYEGISLTRCGDPTRGNEIMRCAMEAARNINSNLFRPLHLGCIAASHALLGQPDVGLSSLNEAILMADDTQERVFEAELHRLRGELLVDLGNIGEAEMALERALTVARNQQARMWELRAAASLARLRRDQGRHAEARDLLAPVYGWFTEGFETPDLKDAKALLDELG
jgi:predicted ATPase